MQRADVLREVPHPRALLAENSELLPEVRERALRRAALSEDLLLGLTERPADVGPQLADGLGAGGAELGDGLSEHGEIRRDGRRCRRSGSATSEGVCGERSECGRGERDQDRLHGPSVHLLRRPARRHCRTDVPM